MLYRIEAEQPLSDFFCALMAFYPPFRGCRRARLRRGESAPFPGNPSEAASAQRDSYLISKMRRTFCREIALRCSTRRTLIVRARARCDVASFARSRAKFFACRAHSSAISLRLKFDRFAREDRALD